MPAIPRKGSIDVALADASELMNVLYTLPEMMRKRVYKRAMVKAMAPIRRKAAANAKAIGDTGLLAKSIKTKAVVYKNGTVYGVIGPRKDISATVTRKPRKGQPKPKPELARPVKYAHLVELGTAHSAAKPFLRPALDSEGGKAYDAFAKAISEGLDQETRRIVKKL